MTVSVLYFAQNPYDILRDLGRRIRNRRIAANLTQGQLAKQAGVARRTITRMEAGENIGIEPIVRVALALDATAEFGALFPTVDTRTLDEILAAQRTPRRVRHRSSLSTATKRKA
jgi:transcriptional regulator with XRE-family HTH domain